MAVCSINPDEPGNNFVDFIHSQAGPFLIRERCHVSFISLRLVLPALVPLREPDGDLVALVKPQFEAGRGQVGRGGVVRDEAVREEAIAAVVAAARDLGLEPAGRLRSPLPGPAGNVEELAWFRRPAGRPEGRQ